ncbi:bestrophin-like domain [Rhizobium mongolense]|uniref:bestrophin-like domain n=1 Tax=Rhizobium mongolense TaxID=57676 RepID=UPI0034A4CA1A
MGSILIGGAVFVCLVGAALLGMFLRERIPSHHLDSDSKDVIRLATAIVGTLSALALGLLIASAKNDYDTTDAELRSSVAQVLLLDRVMAQYGTETAMARARLRDLIEARLRHGWGDANPDDPVVDPYDVSQTIEPIQAELRALVPKDDARRMIQTRALEVSGNLAEAHWMAVETDAEGLPTAFLVILVFWLAWLFATFGLQAPANLTVVSVILVCSLSVAAAVFLVVDMAHPYIGVIHVSEAPLRSALAHIGNR